MKGCSRPSTTEQDAIISDELNHASIIDGVRLAKARKERYKNRDMADLRRALEATKDTRNKLVMTDGVFSMEGSLAPLPEIVELAREYGAFLVVDESHGTGVLGKTGRGTPEEQGVFGKIDAYTSTLGKALGGSHGGFTTGPKALVDYLRQKSRPYLFSNTLPPAVVMGSLAAIDLVQNDTSFVDRLRENTRYFREQLTARGVRVREGIHPDRADHHRRHRQSHRHVAGAARARRLRLRLRLPGRPAGSGAAALPDQRRAHARAPRPGHSGDQRRGVERVDSFARVAPHPNPHPNPLPSAMRPPWGEGT